jgi:hypothetical protein
VLVSGVVLSEVDGRPIQGARVQVRRHVEPCPSLPAEDRSATVSAATDEEGRFELRGPAGVELPAGGFDVYARAPGHVLAMACAQRLPGEMTLRLPKALPVKVHVRDQRGRPVPGASVEAVPSPGTAATPGHASSATTNDQGDALLDGLLAGNVHVEIDHAHFWPSRSGPYDPARDDDVTFALTPALRAKFRIRSDDGRKVENTTLHWETSGPTAKSELLLLSCTPLEVKGDAGSEVQCAPVRIPCDAPSVTFSVKSDGYATWTSAAEALPADGDERTYDVVLAGDRSVGSIRLTLEDEAGTALAWNATSSEVLGVVSEGPPPTAGYVVEGGEDLRFPAMPAGKYRVLIASPAYAPHTVETQVVAGRTTEVRATVRPPAKVRVRFTAPERMVVLFRLTHDGKPVFAAPEGAVRVASEEPGKERYHMAGEQGLLLSGLGGGSYVIEVMTPEVFAPPTTVRLQEGQTEEVEIDVRHR